MALIRKDAGDGCATIRFAQNAAAAERGEWSPFTLSADGLTKNFCSLDKAGAPLLRALPEDVPTLLRYDPADWEKLSGFRSMLDKAAGHVSWPQTASAAWRSFLEAPPCALHGVAFDLQGLRSPPDAVPQLPRHADYGDRELAVCPLVTKTRTATDYARDVAKVGGGRDKARFNLKYSELESEDFAFVLSNAPHAFTVQVKGKQSPRVELLEIKALVATRRVCAPSRHAHPSSAQSRSLQVEWLYWKLVRRSNGVLVFTPDVLPGGMQRAEIHPYLSPDKKGSDMLMVWNLGNTRGTHIVSGEYTLEPEQLYDLQQWCGRLASVAVNAPSQSPYSASQLLPRPACGDEETEGGCRRRR